MLIHDQLTAKTSEPAVVACETQLGWMALAHGRGKLQGLVFGHPTKKAALASINVFADFAHDSLQDASTDWGAAWIDELKSRLVAYAGGDPIAFDDVPLAQDHLSQFARRVVRHCRRVPYGGSISYGDLAAQCGSPGAARAVGRVMASNRFPLIVPCHRVLGAGGKLGGFSAPQGVSMKRRLLEMESRTAP